MMVGGIIRSMNMLKLKISLLAALGLCAIQIANASLSANEVREQNKVYLEKIGIRLLDGDVKIVPAKGLINHSKDEFYNSEVQNFLAMHDEQLKNGYVKQDEPRAKELLDFPKTAKYQYQKYQNELSQGSTHLRHMIDELKMAYTFVGVPVSDMDVNIGVAPYGAYKQVKYGDENDGWDGAVQFFVKRGIGVCEFKEHNIKLAHGGVELIQELVSDEIFGKPTVLLTKGNNDTGFLYQVSWYNNIFARELSCASPDFSGSIKNDVIELAKRIESNQ